MGIWTWWRGAWMEAEVSPLLEVNGRSMQLTCLLEEYRVMNERAWWEDGGTHPSNVDRRSRSVLGRVPVCFLTSEYFYISNPYILLEWHYVQEMQFYLPKSSSSSCNNTTYLAIIRAQIYWWIFSTSTVKPKSKGLNQSSVEVQQHEFQFQGPNSKIPFSESWLLGSTSEETSIHYSISFQETAFWNWGPGIEIRAVVPPLTTGLVLLIWAWQLMLKKLLQ